MMDKQKQIEELSKDLEEKVVTGWSKELYVGSAESLYKEGWRKITNDLVVMPKEYYDEMCADVNEYEEYEERLLARLTDVIERCQKKLKSVLEKVWDNATTNDEVGSRWILLQIAKEEGVTLDRELKKYGKDRDSRL